VQARDAAGNVSSLVYDGITLEVPVPTYAWKGYYTTGATRVYYNPVTDPPGGSSTTVYYIYSTTDPAANPNNGDPVTYRGGTTSTVYAYVAVPAGQLHYLFVRAYDADTGGWGPYSAASVLGFSGNVTVIYDDDEGADITRANALKALLEDSQNITSDSYVFGTMPSWTVTLLPEDLVSNTYDTGGQNMIYGDPVILTPGTSFTTASSYDGKVRNIAAAGRGVLAMSYAGAYFLERVDANWVTWAFAGQRPDSIHYGHTMGLTSVQSAKTRPSSVSENIWFTPLYYSILYNSYRESSIGANLFTSNVGRLGVYISSGANPAGGFIYAGDQNYASHFPAVRQGRFLTFGFAEVPNILRTGEVFFINLVSRMAAF
jgi:hypothetical protein